MSQRKQIELAIIKRLEEMLEKDNYIYIKKEECFTKHINDKVNWSFNFYLTDKKAYSGFSTAAVEYIKLTEIINKLVKETPLSYVGVSTSMGVFSDKLIFNKICTIDEVDSYAEMFCQILKVVEQQYFNPFSDELTAVNKFKLRPTKWPVADLGQCVCHLVAYGIENNDKETISFGINKGIELTESNFNDRKYRDFVLSLRQALYDKGYLDV